MSITSYKLDVDNKVTNKTDPLSISNVEVGELMKAAVDFFAGYHPQGGSLYGSAAKIGTADAFNVDWLANNVRSGRLFSSGRWLFGSGTTDAGYLVDIGGTLRVQDILRVQAAAPEINIIGNVTNSGVKALNFYHNTKAAWIKSTPQGSADTGGLTIGAYQQDVINILGAGSTPTGIVLNYTTQCPEFTGNGVNSGTHYISFNSSEKAVRIASQRIGSNGKGSYAVLMNSAANNLDAVMADAVIYIPGGTGAGAKNVNINNSNADMGAALGVNGTTKFMSKTTWDGTVTPIGTTGNVTIDKPSGTVNIAAGGTSVVVTNILCNATSTVLAVIRTNDSTATIKNVVPAAGSFTVNLGAAATAATSIGFLVIN